VTASTFTVERITSVGAAELATLNAAFSDLHGTLENISAFLADPNNFLIVARLEGRIVGRATAHLLARIDDARAEIFINSIDVHRAQRRKGVGRAMLEFLKELGRARGASEMWVLAEGRDSNAINFYIATGGDASAATMFDYDL
jgi:aminoglycoside 3-N-acetyltransferase I